MLDQTFSARNFRRVYDIENRRGRNVDKTFFPDLVDASARITAASTNIREARKANASASKDALEAILLPLREKLKAERKFREDLVDSKLAEIANEVLSGHQIQLVSRSGPNGAALFTLPEDARAYFISKQIQHNIKRLYKVKPGNRRAIVSQIYDCLNSSFPQFVLRTDITRFYESIDRKQLVKDLDTDQLLSYGSKKFIKQALSSFGAISRSSTGVPRGLGISAFLSEIYMRSIDQSIKNLPCVTYYARYVDDIIIIISPSAGDDCSRYLTEISDILSQKKLSMNSAKTTCGFAGLINSFHFDYLGYRFEISGGNCKISMGQKKISRYRNRIELSFADYMRRSATDQKGAGRLLVARIKFITGNTRLLNNKRHAYTGIYFNNSQLTELGQLGGLDAFLRHKIGTLASANLQNRLDGYSFALGFRERRFSSYNSRMLAQIVEAWRYEA